MAPERAPAVRGSGPIGVRLVLFLGLLVAGGWAIWVLQLDPRRLWPGSGGLQLASDFFGHALRPALTHEGSNLPPDLPPLLLQSLAAAWQTVVFAAAALPPAILGGLAIGFGGATAWWAPDRARGLRMRAPFAQRLRLLVGPIISGGCRLLAVWLRSVHELLWAVVLLAILGITPLAALIALALPYAGVLAKVFAEMIDEAPRQAAGALREAGASNAQVFAFGLLPQALPDMIAYALYRFECGLRSAAVLGFFGLPTLGYYLAASFENLHYGEVWTYLYTLLLLVVTVDWWSGAMRRRLVS